MKYDNLWVEKYRPSSINDLLVDDDSKARLLTFKSLKEIPHMLFVSGAGTGKTTTAKIIAKELLGSDYLYINASEENGIDTIRNKVTSFSETKSFDGGIKIIILDEVDGLTKPAQEALRGSMEYYSENTRYILTANYKNKLIDPLLSRVQQFQINFDKKDVVRLCYKILKAENVICDKENAQKMVKLIYEFYPDVRKSINFIQKYSYTGTLVIKDDYCDDELMDFVIDSLKSNKVLDLRKYLIENSSKFASDYNIFLKNLLEVIYKGDFSDNIKQESILILGESLYRMVSVTDKEILSFVTLIQLSKVLNNC